MVRETRTGVLPGVIRQNGYVVRDVDAAIDAWLALGVGPWFVLRERPQAMQHRGAMVEPTMTIAFANSGELQVELIQQHDEVPSVYREFLDAGGEGLHHHAWWAEDYDAALATARAGGLAVVASGDGGGVTRYSYLETPAGPAVVELMELGSLTAGYMDHIRAASIGWDGADPVR